LEQCEGLEHFGGGTTLVLATPPSSAASATCSDDTKNKTTITANTATQVDWSIIVKQKIYTN
jgi:hypothetical protein